MQVVNDVNLSPSWVETLQAAGISAIHWRAIGPLDAPDQLIFTWAREHQHIVFTHDLDFGTILALTGAIGPSVVHVRTQDVSVEHLGATVIRSLQAHAEALTSGALLTIDEYRARIKLLPLRSTSN
ncbi:MAG: DUF5615 family PIN-like protein [Bacteroidetes bacterium]|nr:DUF5615 family PIN-like protein [Bacteroidota bacterium]